jgi:hypothetical protein
MGPRSQTRHWPKFDRRERKSEHRGRDAYAEPIDAIRWHSADDQRVKSVVYCPATRTSRPPTSFQPAQILAAWEACVRNHIVI